MSVSNKPENPTMESWIRAAAADMETEGLFFGHGTDNAIDEACWLASAGLGLPPDFDPQLFAQVLDREQVGHLDGLLSKRIETRQPLAYLLGEAWLAGLSFEVTTDVLVPRSPLAELIIDGFEPWLSESQLQRAVDVGTGSGCLAIVLAHHHPQCRVDALDVSPAALALAERNAQRHSLSDRVAVIESDLLGGVPGERYDLILTNPPYVPTASMDNLPAEFEHEPRLGLEAGADGLDLVWKLLIQAPDHLSEHGILVCEVGEAAEALQAMLAPDIEPIWLEFAHGGDGVFLLEKDAVMAAAAKLES
ncbi:MAG: 50S ribosomal protein L3 N(5)-glutamine methyltransferase [Pseudomonadota bacterium]